MNILVTGARSLAALEVIRNFGFYGNTLYAADSVKNPICKYSKFLKKYFFVASSKFDEKRYISQIVGIVNDFSIDVLFPICEEIFYISKNKSIFEKLCPNLKILADDFDKLKLLHNKFEFYKLSQNLGIPAAKSIFVSSKTDLDEFIKENGEVILRPIFSRFGTSALKIHDSVQIKEDFINQNLIASKFISDGKLVCYYCFCENGKIKFDISYSSPLESSVNACTIFEIFKNDDKIRKYAEKIIKFLNLSGNISFDFIHSRGEFYIIECNPRITSGIHMFAKNNFEEMFFKNISSEKVVKISSQIFILNILDFKNYNFKFLNKVFLLKDVLFCRSDLKPFFAVPMFVFEILKISAKESVSLIDATTYDINWNGE